MPEANVDPDDAVRRHQGHLQLGQGREIEVFHRLGDESDHLLDRALDVLVTVTIEQGEQQHIEELRVARPPHLLQVSVLAVLQQLPLQEHPVREVAVLGHDPRGLVEGEWVAVLVDHDDLRVVARCTHMAEHGVRLEARDDALCVVVVERGHGPAVDERILGLEQVLAPGTESPACQL